MDDTCFLSERRRKSVSSKIALKPELHLPWSPRGLGGFREAGARHCPLTPEIPRGTELPAHLYPLLRGVPGPGSILNGLGYYAPAGLLEYPKSTL